MNVLFLSWAYPKQNTPYLGIWAHQQALALRKRGVEVEVVNAVPYVPQAAGFVSGKIRAYADIPLQESFEGIRVYHPRFLRASPESWADRMLFRFQEWQTASMIRRLGSQVDFKRYEMIHAHNLFPDGAFAYRLFRRYGIPYIITLHDVDRFNSVGGTRSQQALGEKILQHASRVLAVSSRVKNNLQPQVPDRRIDILYNTFWTHGREHKQAPGKQIVLIASLIVRKGIYEMLKAFARIVSLHPDWELVIIGDGCEADRVRLEADALGISRQVAFTGKQSHEDAMALLSRAAIFCLPSWDEAFGVVYAEAMSYGVPVVGCRGEGIADVVTDGVNGMLVEPRNVGELEEALLFLIEHPDAAAEIGKRGQQSIGELHPDVFSVKLEGIYRAALEVNEAQAAGAL